MSWAIIGWMLIGLSAILLVLFPFLMRRKSPYKIRKSITIENLLTAQSGAIERGQPRLISFGDEMWSRTYPGLGLHALTLLPKLVDEENALTDGTYVSGGDGSLATLARQIVNNRYHDGFSMILSRSKAQTIMPGTGRISYAVGLLLEIEHQGYGSVALFGNFGPEAVLWTEAVQNKGGYVFAGAGSLSSQAALLINVKDLLIGESLFSTSVPDATGVMTEDVLRLILILGLVVGVILKLAGVL
jgi:hypothetical protein